MRIISSCTSKTRFSAIDYRNAFSRKDLLSRSCVSWCAGIQSKLKTSFTLNTRLKAPFLSRHAPSLHIRAHVFDEAIFRYMLFPEESKDDVYYLLTNGSLFAPRIDHVPLMLMPGENYCMEVVPEMGLRALVCFQGLKLRYLKVFPIYIPLPFFFYIFSLCLLFISIHGVCSKIHCRQWKSIHNMSYKCLVLTVYIGTQP